jgi:hypothetical protein
MLSLETSKHLIHVAAREVKDRGKTAKIITPRILNSAGRHFFVE